MNGTKLAERTRMGHPNWLKEPIVPLFDEWDKIGACLLIILNRNVNSFITQFSNFSCHLLSLF